MNRKAALFALLTLAAILSLTSVALAVIEFETVRYERPVRVISGKLTAAGHIVPNLSVQVYDNANVWLDDSMTPVERRKKQNLIASVEPNDRGEFKVKRLPKGFYEVEFGNGGMGGYNIVSVLVNVEPTGAKDKLCVDVSLEGAPSPRSSVRKCTPK